MASAKIRAKVTVVTVGDESCDPILRKCLAIEADQALRVNIQAKDGFQVASILSTIARIKTMILLLRENQLIIMEVW